jgi:hypothetical protein
MPVTPEVLASITIVAGDWAKFLASVEPRKRKAVLKGMVKRYAIINQMLQSVHIESSPSIGWRPV